MYAGLPIGKVRPHACTLKAWEKDEAALVLMSGSRRIGGISPLAK